MTYPLRVQILDNNHSAKGKEARKETENNELLQIDHQLAFNSWIGN